MEAVGLACLIIEPLNLYIVCSQASRPGPMLRGGVVVVLLGQPRHGTVPQSIMRQFFGEDVSENEMERSTADALPDGAQHPWYDLKMSSSLCAAI